ncbi:MAG: alkaline phosphatase [Planctomycetaceae bacterium]
MKHFRHFCWSVTKPGFTFSVVALLLFISEIFLPLDTQVSADDYVRDLQTLAIQAGVSPVGHWGNDPANYTMWSSHSSRLVPIYTFGTKGAGEGIDLSSYTGENSLFRDEGKITKLYGQLPANTLNPQAEYADQTNVYDIQLAALRAGKKHIFLVIFDGMDWQTTYAAAVYSRKEVSYTEGRGTGLHMLDYPANGTTQFGSIVTTPYLDDVKVDVNTQSVVPIPMTQPGGYNAEKGGAFPWSSAADKWYLIGKTAEGLGEHAVPDSAATATSMNTGFKTYNNSINIDIQGNPLKTIAHLAQENGYGVGVVSSVPISHATPAAAYAHNVYRNDYQDLTRDLLGLPSISHPQEPLPGVDVLIGTGYGLSKDKDASQGDNFVPGEAYLSPEDFKAIQMKNGGKYLCAVRETGVDGSTKLRLISEQAATEGRRLFGFYGAGMGSHLPFQTADGDYRPTIGRSPIPEVYSEADLRENPTLSEMTAAALRVLETRPSGFWMMVEAGDVDWANHDNNLDNSIGAVLSGDAAVKTITEWVENHSHWDESVLIVTADHGHFLVLENPVLLIPPQ